MTTVEDHVDDAIALLEVDRLEQAFEVRMCEHRNGDECREVARWLLIFKPCACQKALCTEHSAETHKSMRATKQRYHAEPARTVRHKACDIPVRVVDIDITANPI